MKELKKGFFIRVRHEIWKTCKNGAFTIVCGNNVLELLMITWVDKNLIKIILRAELMVALIIFSILTKNQTKRIHF